MSLYLRHFTTQAASKSGRLYTCDIYEDGYIGSVVNLPAALRPFEQNVLASSDDPFEPVLASELKVSLDITDATEIPILTSRDDKKYFVKLSAQDYPIADTSNGLWKLYETSSPSFIDCNLKIWVNGVNVLTQFTAATGSLIFNTGDTVLVECTNLISPTNPAGSGWKLQIQKNGGSIYSGVNTTAAIGTELSYTFTVTNQSVYEILCCTYQIGDDSQTVPVNPSYDVFQGWILMDSTRLSFSTGRRFLDLSISDGIAMLKNFRYYDNYQTPSVTPLNNAVLVDINTTESLLAICLRCLNKLTLAQGFKLNIACNIYPGGASTSSCSFSQIYYYIRNWQNSDLTFQDCYTVLQTICRSFGCQIFQAGSEYWIVNVNERCADLRYFQYDQSGTLVSSGTIAKGRTIKPYVDSTTPHFFVNNSQSKNIRKGYPVISLKNNYSFAPNLIDNGNLKRAATVGTDIVYNWQKTVPATGTLSVTTLSEWVALSMGIATTGATTVQPLSIARGFMGDSLTLSFTMCGYITTPTLPACQVLLFVADIATGTVQYYLDNNNQWVLGTGTFRNVTSSTTGLFERVSITTPPLPEDCNIYMTVRVAAGITMANVIVADFSLTASSPNQYKTALGYYNFLSNYKKDQDIIMGGQYDMCMVGALLDSTKAILGSWYRYGVTESYLNLTALILQQYINCLSAAQVNIEGDIMSLFGNNDASVLSLLTLIDTIKFQDSTSFLSVNGFKFIFGNCRINYTDDEIGGTFLNVSNTDITETITDIVTQKNN